LLGITHRAIAEKIAKELGLSQKDTSLLVSGVLGPDTHADFPHATGKDGKILYHLDNARALFLENDDNCYSELGNVLHYIQDKWCSTSETEKKVSIISDELLLDYINRSEIPDDSRKCWLETINVLKQIREKGIESWFNHSWGFFNKNFSNCVFIFTDVLENMLPTMKPEIPLGDTEKIKIYIQSEAFKASISDGLIYSIKNNFLKPKISGYPGAMSMLVLINPPPQSLDVIINVNVAFRLSMEIARLTLSKAEYFKFVDDWTQRGEFVGGKIGLTYVMPNLLVLIRKPVGQVYKERKARFEEEVRLFLEEWSEIKDQLPVVKTHSEVWKILLTKIVELLSQDEYWNE